MTCVGELGNVLSQAQQARGEKTSTPDDPVEVLAQLHRVPFHAAGIISCRRPVKVRLSIFIDVLDAAATKPYGDLPGHLD